MKTITGRNKYIKFFYPLVVLMLFQQILQHETTLKFKSMTENNLLQRKKFDLKRSSDFNFSDNIYSMEDPQIFERSRMLEESKENDEEDNPDEKEDEENDEEGIPDEEEDEENDEEDIPDEEEDEENDEQDIPDEKEEEDEENSNEAEINKNLIFKKKSSKNLQVQSTDPDMRFEITYKKEYQLNFYEEYYFSSLFNGFIIGIQKNADSVLTVFTNENCGFPLLVASFDSEPKFSINTNDTNEINIEAEYFGISDINKLEIDEEKIYEDYLSDDRSYNNELYIQFIDFQDIANDFIYLGIYCLFYKSSNTNFYFTTLVNSPSEKEDNNDNNDSNDDRITVHDIDSSIDDSDKEFSFEDNFELAPDTAVILNFINLPGRSAISFNTFETSDLTLGVIYNSEDKLKILNYTRSDSENFDDIRAENMEVQIYNLLSSSKQEIKVSIESRNPPFEIANINGILFIVIIVIIGLILFSGIGYIIYKKCFAKKDSNRAIRNDNETENPRLNIDHNNPAERTSLNNPPYNFVIDNNEQLYNYNQEFIYDQSARNTYGQEQLRLQIPTDFANQNQPQFQYPLPSNVNELEVSSRVVKTELPDIHNHNKKLKTYNVDVERLEYPSFENPDALKEYSIVKK